MFHGRSRLILGHGGLGMGRSDLCILSNGGTVSLLCLFACSKCVSLREKLATIIQCQIHMVIYQNYKRMAVKFSGGGDVNRGM